MLSTASAVVAAVIPQFLILGIVFSAVFGAFAIYNIIKPLPPLHISIPTAKGASEQRSPLDDGDILKDIEKASIPSLTQDAYILLLTEQAHHEIVPGLFLGGSDYQPKKIYSYNGMEEKVQYDAIVSATMWKPKGCFEPKQDAKVYSFPVDPERKPPDITLASLQMENGRYLREAISFIDKNIKSGKKVFVHCQQGKDRSPTIVMAYIMSKYGVTFDKAFTFVRSKRMVADPLDVYLKFLRDEFVPVKLN